jgi:hypothetical protein
MKWNVLPFNQKAYPLNYLFPLKKKPFFLESIFVTVYNPPLTLDVFYISFFGSENNLNQSTEGAKFVLVSECQKGEGNVVRL